MIPVAVEFEADIVAMAVRKTNRNVPRDTRVEIGKRPDPVLEETRSRNRSATAGTECDRAIIIIADRIPIICPDGRDARLLRHRLRRHAKYSRNESSGH